MSWKSELADKFFSTIEKKVLNVGGKKAAKYGDEAVKQLGDVLATITGKDTVKEAAQKAVTRAERYAATKAKVVANKASKDMGRTRFALGTLNAKTPTIVKVATPLAAAYGAYKYGGNLVGGSDTALTPEQWQSVLTTNTTTGTPVMGADGKPLDYYGQLDKAARDRYNNTTFVAPDTKFLDAQSALAQQYGTATAAAINDLAGQYAQTAGGIKQRGEAGASAINDIYGQGASAMDALATAPSDGMSGMIPVSGDAALAGQYSQAQGQSVADYLRANGLIDAQAAGQLAGYTQLLGPAYQSQYNLLDMQARQAAENQQAQRLADFQMAQQARLQEDLATTAMQRATDARTAISTPIDPTELAQYVAEWNSLEKDIKNIYEAKGITDAVGFVKEKIAEKRRAAQVL